MNNLVAMKTLLPLQQANCAITQLYLSILSPHEAHIFLGTKCVSGLYCCYGNTVTDMFLSIIHASIFTVTH